ncbi:heat shock protein HslJ [Budviciaceae bacterium CWB-B4]|uniref:Heat shock protein HslJ n=1 Tax=Limnobaculum xujianqingii TaxID=2738837 RepID=A0A9D7AI22_9GAMM|nr:heat shock protein HslJ [Limnobaculum xujianqingii]MBK5073098.1 heat shock protein HslJ [Limnobaculum xujianqingii]MBK5176407.1 heat shock protein HslJ [Limnobaculum xujianqingii]
MKIALPFIISAVLLSGCTLTDSNSVKESDLQHHNFILIGVDGKNMADTTKEKRPLNIEFGENMHVSGTMCNRFMGQATLKNGVLTAKQLASTRMACIDEQISQLDQVIATTLSNGAKVTLDQGVLTLSSSQHTLTYKLKDWVN